MALRELRALDDANVLGLTQRLERRQSEVIGAIAEKNAQVVASLRPAARAA